MLVLVLATVALVVVWGFTGEQRQDRVIDTVMVVFFALVLLVLWLLLLSRLRWPIRLSVFGLLVLLGVAASFTVTIRGVSGDLVPILDWRWSRAEEVPVPAVAEDAVPPPASTTTDPRHDYPQFLGPRRDGTVEGAGLARDWSAEPPVELWRQPVGAGWSGFAVVGSFAVTHEQRGDRETVTCYDVTSGRLLWSHADPVRFDHPIAGPGPRATPAIDAGRVYALGATGILNALDLRTGERLWSRNVIEESGASVPTYGVSASPLLDGDVVIVASGGGKGRALAAYHRDTGEPAWSGGGGYAAYSSPVIAQLADARQLLLFNGGGLAAHDPASGETLWRHAWPSGTERASQPVVLPGDRVFLSTGYGVGGKLFQIGTNDSGGFSIGLVWESRGLKAKFTNVVHRDGHLYGLDDGILVCLDPETGERRWKRGRYGHGQVILAGDLLIIQAESGGVALVEATPEEYRELGRITALDGKTWNHAALAGRRLLVRNDRAAACYELPGRS